jgi:hypothetical protein
MSLTLSPDELEELTGYKIPACQIKWLKAHGWCYVEAKGGRPKVSRKFAEQKLGVVQPANDDQAEPDFSILKKSA